MTDTRKPYIWFLNLSDAGVISELDQVAELHFGSYAPYQAGSGFVLSEYDAVVWNQGSPTGWSDERNRQLQSFLRNRRGVFVFFLQEYKQQSAIINSNLAIVFELLISQNRSFPNSIKHDRKGSYSLLTPEGQICPFRQYLEYQPLAWFLPFEQSSWLVPLAVNVEQEPVAVSLTK